jgi:centractin
MPAFPCSYAAGRTTGLVLDCGEGSTTAVPVYEGFAVSSAITRSDIGGCDVTDQLQLLLRRNGVALTTSAEREIVREMKEKVCEVDQRPRAEAGYVATAPNVTYLLPDGNAITLGSERIRAAEVLFCPSIIGCEDGGSSRARAPAPAALQRSACRRTRRRYASSVKVRSRNVIPLCARHLLPQ